MGLALAAAAARRGAEVTLIAANVSLPEPAGVRRIDVENAAELAEATRSEFPSSQVLLMAAAPADFRPPAVEPGKLKRDDGLELRLEPTEDILAGLAARRSPGQTIVGFAAEAGEGARGRAREKRERKGVDLIVLNDVSDPAIGFESADNAVTLIDAEAESEVPISSKEEIAIAILDRVDKLRQPGARSGLY
jgi:phosphopantothenoylcysteine decarboxylase/phosphopantothenate--cysteine ligase